MTKKVILILVAMALVVAAGTVTKTGAYQFTLFRPAAVNGSVLQPGDYKLVLRDSMAIVTAQDGTTLQAPVKVETAPSKFDNTALTIELRDSKPVISEIDLRGSKIKLLFAH